MREATKINKRKTPYTQSTYSSHPVPISIFLVLYLKYVRTFRVGFPVHDFTFLFRTLSVIVSIEERFLHSSELW